MCGGGGANKIKVMLGECFLPRALQMVGKGRHQNTQQG